MRGTPLNELAVVDMVVMLVKSHEYYADLSAGPEGTCLITGLLWAEEGFQAEESRDQSGAEEGGMSQTGEPV